MILILKVLKMFYPTHTMKLLGFVVKDTSITEKYQTEQKKDMVVHIVAGD